MSTLALVVTLLGGCASGGGYSGPTLRTADVEWAALWPEIAEPATAEQAGFRPRAPEGDDLARLRAAERAFEALADVSADDPAAAQAAEQAWADARAAVVEEPLTGYWMGRRLLFAVLVNVDQRSADEGGMIRSAGASRAQRELVAMGEAAAPVLILDLLRSDRADRRELGAELLQQMGPAAMPALRRVLDVDDVRTRRYAVKAVAGWPPSPEGRAVLLDAIRDPDFGVRAEGWRGFVHGPDDLALLKEAMRGRETDPFARRAIYEALGHYQDREAAGMLLDEMERAIAASDSDTGYVLLEALQQATGRSDLAGTPAFRRFLETWNPEAGSAPIDGQR